MLQLDHMGHELAGLGILVSRFVREFGTLLQRLSHRHRRDELLALRNHGDAIEGQHRIPHLNLFVFGEGGLGIDADLDLGQTLGPKHRPLNQRTIDLVQEDIQILILEDDGITGLIGSTILTQRLQSGIIDRLILLRRLTRLGRSCGGWLAGTRPDLAAPVAPGGAGGGGGVARGKERGKADGKLVEPTATGAAAFVAFLKRDGGSGNGGMVSTGAFAGTTGVAGATVAAGTRVAGANRAPGAAEAAGACPKR